MFHTQFLDQREIGGTNVLSDDFLGNVPADVLAVVAWFLDLYCFLLGLEQLGLLTQVHSLKVDNEVAIVIDRRVDELPEQ